MKQLITLITLTILFNQILIAGTYGGGSGTSGNPYKISTAADLYELSSTSTDWRTGIYFEQTNNITVTGEWSPIGNSTTYFRGTYDGKGYTISGVTITNRFRNDYWAFFGYTDGATIQNLGLVSMSIDELSDVGGLIAYAFTSTISNCYTTGTVSGYYGYVGGLIAVCYSTSISNCYSTATVTGGTSGIGSYSGGLVGRCTYLSTISNSYHITGNVSGRDYVGGLVGGIENSSSVSQCYSSGSVVGTSQVGGLLGHLSASVYDSYSRANVSNSGSNSGGLVGQNSSGSINKCYSTGNATGSVNVGGLLGYNDGGTTTNSFWDKTNSGLESSAGGTGKTEAEMKTQSTFTGAGWSSEIWYMDAEFNNGYPYLHWENAGTPLPVELTSFSVQVNNRNLVLSWETATEVDNYGFEIERREKLNVKGETWQTVGFVKGHGNSNSAKSYSFTDKKLNSGRYSYRLKMINTDGSFEYSSIVEVEIGTPKEFALSQNYPNPFNPTTKIVYQLPFNSEVKIELFSITGERVAVLVNQQQEAGYYTIEVNTSKLRLASGVYVYRIVATNTSNSKTYINTKKLVVLR